LSGMADTELAKEAVSEGAQDFIPKQNITRIDISSVIRYSIERQKIVLRLVSAEEKANRLVELKQKFLAQMSHEIRTPMNTVVGMTNVLLESNLTEDQRDCLKVIQRSADSLMRIINDILDITKLEAEKLVLHEDDIDLRKLIEETLEQFAERISEKRLVLANIISPDVPTFVRGDRGRIRQIITNLVGNAVKCTDMGQITVQTMVESQNGNDVILKFLIRDTGIGISEEDLKSLFKEFSQIVDGHNKNNTGTGLGLVISKMLCELMGGNIGVTSKYGEGSTFWFNLKLKVSIKKGERSSKRYDIGGKSVLILGTNPDSMSILSEILDLRGMKIKTAMDIESAVITLLSPYEKIDLIIIDTTGVSDISWKRWVNTFNNKGIIEPKLLLSAPSAVIRSEALKYGISSVFKEPIRQRELYCKIAEILNEDVTSSDRESDESAIGTIMHLEDHEVLVVDDNPLNLKVEVKMLSLLGYKTDTAANGREAIEKLGSRKYSAVLMDSRMPEMDGTSATRAIRSDQRRFGKIPIIGVTANAFQEDINECLGSGMNDVLTKPVTIDMLKSALDKWISGDFESESALKINLEENMDEIDRKVIENLNKLGGGDPMFLNELIDMYFKLIPEISEQLRKSLTDNDRKAVVHYAHKMKGTSRNLGAKKIGDLCEILEKNALTIDFNRAEEILNEISDRYHKSEIEFRSNWYKVAV
ncbi:MAG: response regulator, partial [Oligoflexales bacterium]|nr:response regulator [Oligoflexales bacterium]